MFSVTSIDPIVCHYSGARHARNKHESSNFDEDATSAMTNRQNLDRSCRKVSEFNKSLSSSTEDDRGIQIIGILQTELSLAVQIDIRKAYTTTIYGPVRNPQLSAYAVSPFALDIDQDFPIADCSPMPTVTVTTEYNDTSISIREITQSQDSGDWMTAV
jgi:hypothetical protein